MLRILHGHLTQRNAASENAWIIDARLLLLKSRLLRPGEDTKYPLLHKR